MCHTMTLSVLEAQCAAFNGPQLHMLVVAVSCATGVKFTGHVIQCCFAAAVGGFAHYKAGMIAVIAVAELSGNTEAVHLVSRQLCQSLNVAVALPR